MAFLTCPRCGRDNDQSFACCVGCGLVLRAARDADRRCPTCQNPIDPGYRFCGHCGRALPTGQPSPMHPNPLMTPPPVLSRVPRPPGQAPAVPGNETALSAAMPGGAVRRPTRLVPMRRDGQPGAVLPLGTEPIVCGRTRGQLRLEEDSAISPEHARFEFRGETLYVEDLGSLNGTFIRLRVPRPLLAGDEIRIGRQLLRVEPMPRPIDGTGARPWGSADVGYRVRLIQLLEGGGTGEVFPLLAGENTIGREVAWVCFPSDRFVSARHARIDVAATGMVLADVGSSNGTFARIAAPEPLSPGDQILIGLQLIRVE